MKYKYIILGAGPAGLTLANVLKQNNENNFLLLEKESECGGLCRSKVIDGAYLDIGGGHFLDADNVEVCDFLFNFMHEDEWNKFDRISKIELDAEYINHPIEANIWQLSQKLQIEYLKSIAIAGCNLNKPKPEKFVEWIYWKLGEKIANDYMIPYNQKMFGEELNDLGTYWLEKLPNVSFDETLLSCLNKKAYGKEPGHTRFYYPKKYGYGEIWNRMGKNIANNLLLNKKVTKLNILNKSIVTDDGEKYEFESIISTIPWISFEEIEGAPDSIVDSIKKLKISSTIIEYINQNIDSNAHWIYYPSLTKKYHRILLRKNFLPNSKGYWTETNKNRFNYITNNFYYENEYAYPLNTIEKPKIMDNLLNYMKKYNVYGLGRWGEHSHYNSDKVVKLAMDLGKRLIEGY